MKKKYLYISNLAKETAGNIVKNEEAWTGFLTTAARLYKYPFHEQMLIYAQRPEATACASIEIWNGKMNCWVNKGAKGIALIDEDAPSPRLKYVFDVADIHKARRIGRDPYLWELREEHKSAVMERLEKIYGSTNPEHTFEDRILMLAARITYDCYEEVADDLQHLTEGSLLEGLDEHSLKIHLRETLYASIAYTLLARCGADAGAYLDPMDFEHVHEFNTVPVLSQLGSNTTESCKPILMEIGKAIRAHDRKIFQKTVDNAPNLDYNTLKRKSEDGKPIKHADERSSDYGNDISEERRLLYPEYPDGRTAGKGQNGNPTDKVRNHAEELPSGRI